MIDQEYVTGGRVSEAASDAAIAEFIRTRGVTRCPTACVLPTQASVAEQDRAALAEYAEIRDRRRQARGTLQHPFEPFASSRSSNKR